MSYVTKAESVNEAKILFQGKSVTIIISSVCVCLTEGSNNIYIVDATI